MPLTFELYFSFRSPYSYLATGTLREFVETFDAEIDFRPVLPLAIRTPDFFKRANPLLPGYILRDSKRVAEMKNIPFTWPRPDPVVMDPATRTFPAEQPYIHRLTRLGVAAVEAGRGFAFACEISRTIFGGTEHWHLGDHLARATERAGLNLSDLDSNIEADPDHYDAIIEANQQSQTEAGHWGVPLMVFDGEPFFGQDRIELLQWRMESAGMKRR